jgi:hypothetical protein
MLSLEADIQEKYSLALCSRTYRLTALPQLTW